MSGWISSENVFVAPTKKGEMLPKLADLLKNELFALFSQYEIFIISGQNSPLLSQNVFLQSILYPTKNIIHFNKQHFGMR